MDEETKAAMQAMLDYAVRNLVERIDTLEARLQGEIDTLQHGLDEHTHGEDASVNHYHDEYASADHVERSENAAHNQFYRLEESLRNLEYELSDVRRTAEEAKRTAENTRRGGW